MNNELPKDVRDAIATAAKFEIPPAMREVIATAAKFEIPPAYRDFAAGLAEHSQRALAAWQQMAATVVAPAIEQWSLQLPKIKIPDFATYGPQLADIARNARAAWERVMPTNWVELSTSEVMAVVERVRRPVSRLCGFRERKSSGRFSRRMLPRQGLFSSHTETTCSMTQSRACRKLTTPISS